MSVKTRQHRPNPNEIVILYVYRLVWECNLPGAQIKGAQEQAFYSPLAYNRQFKDAEQIIAQTIKIAGPKGEVLINAPKPVVIITNAIPLREERVKRETLDAALIELRKQGLHVTGEPTPETDPADGRPDLGDPEPNTHIPGEENSQGAEGDAEGSGEAASLELPPAP